MKKIITPVIITALMFSFAACGKTEGTQTSGASDNTSVATQGEATAEIPNPWTDNKDLREANEKAGMNYVLPDEYKSDKTVYRSSDQGVVEVRTTAANTSATFRARKGSSIEDISGVYDANAKKHDIKNHDINVTIQEGADGSVKLAMWNDGNANFSVVFDKEVPEADAVEVISSIIEANTLAY